MKDRKDGSCMPHFSHVDYIKFERGTNVLKGTHTFIHAILSEMYSHFTLIHLLD